MQNSAAIALAVFLSPELGVRGVCQRCLWSQQLGVTGVCGVSSLVSEVSVSWQIRRDYLGAISAPKARQLPQGAWRLAPRLLTPPLVLAGSS